MPQRHLFQSFFACKIQPRNIILQRQIDIKQSLFRKAHKQHPGYHLCDGSDTVNCLRICRYIGALSVIHAKRIGIYHLFSVCHGNRHTGNSVILQNLLQFSVQFFHVSASRPFQKIFAIIIPYFPANKKTDCTAACLLFPNQPQSPERMGITCFLRDMILGKNAQLVTLFLMSNA